MQTTKIAQTISLINQRYSPADALEVLNGIVQEYTRQQSIWGLQKWERDHHFDGEALNKKIKEVKTRHSEIHAMLSEAKLLNSEVEFRISIEVEPAKAPLDIREKPKMSNN